MVLAIEARDVEDLVGLQRLLGEAPRHVQAAIEGGLVHLRHAAVDEHLLDQRQRAQRLRATRLAPHRQRAPAGKFQPLARKLRCQCGARGGSLRRLLREEHQAAGKQGGQLDARLGGNRAQERGRGLQQQAAAIAGLAVRGNRTAVRQARQRGHCGLHQPVAGLIVEAGDQPEATAVAFVGVFVESAVLSVHAWALGLSSSGRQACPAGCLPQAPDEPAIHALRRSAGPSVGSANEQSGPGAGRAAARLPGRLSYTVTMIR